MKKETFKKIIRILKRRYPNFKDKIGDPFKVLIRTLISQRTKDEITDEASRRLFSVAKSPRVMMKLPVEEIERLIKPAGFYRVKARRIKKISSILVKKYSGKVPRSREEILKLPGIGKKTADCVLAFSYGEQTIPVDVHVAVISRRLGITKGEDYDEIQKDLLKITPKKERKYVNYLLVEFGKEICRTVKPRCDVCPIRKWCKFYKDNSLPRRN